jgi:hypothetical protein
MEDCKLPKKIASAPSEVYAALQHDFPGFAMMLDNQPRGTICIEDLEIGMTRYLQKTVTDRDI